MKLSNIKEIEEQHARQETIELIMDKDQVNVVGRKRNEIQN